MSAKIVSVNISDSKGVPKTPIPEGELRPGIGLVGDAHSGAWHRQLSLLALESIQIMRDKGLAVNPGDFAENVTTEGLTLHTLPVGTRLTLGQVEVEVTQIGKECHVGCAIMAVSPPVAAALYADRRHRRCGQQYLRDTRAHP